MSTLSGQIAECIALKEGDKEFALNFLDEEWRAAIGNPSAHVMLGESEPEFASGWCMEAEQAVSELLDLLKQHGGQKPAGTRQVKA